MDIGEERTALVTGAGSGIGRALAQALASQGVRVVVTDVRRDAAEETAATIGEAGGKAMALPLDVTDSVQWEGVLAEAQSGFGPIDIFCSNAGASGSGEELTSMSPDFLAWLLNLNVVSALRGIRAVVPGMRDRGRGQVLITASVTSFIADVTNGDYCATKHALLAIGDTLRRELAGTGVQVGLLCPGPVMTDILANSSSSAQRGGLNIGARDFSDPRLVEISQQSGEAMSPEQVASIALEGMRADRFLIFTHPDAAHRISGRSEEIATALAAVS